MSTAATTGIPWEAWRTEETREVERVLQRGGFRMIDAYRFNSASIRVRVCSNRFTGLAQEERFQLVEPLLEGLPEDTQRDIFSLLLIGAGDDNDPRLVAFKNCE